jgi:hypothetical protein
MPGQEPGAVMGGSFCVLEGTFVLLDEVVVVLRELARRGGGFGLESLYSVNERCSFIVRELSLILADPHCVTS